MTNEGIPNEEWASGEAEPFGELGEVRAVGGQAGFDEALQVAAMLLGVLVKVFVSFRQMVRDG
jgi:hypothetical protein